MMKELVCSDNFFGVRFPNFKQKHDIKLPFPTTGDAVMPNIRGRFPTSVL